MEKLDARLEAKSSRLGTREWTKPRGLELTDLGPWMSTTADLDRHIIKKSFSKRRPLPCVIDR